MYAAIAKKVLVFGSFVVFCSHFPKLPVVLAEAIGSAADSVDIDGDQRADLTLYSPIAGVFTVRSSHDGAMHNLPIVDHHNGDVPVVGDFDGDGRSDFGVFDRTHARWKVSLADKRYKSFSFGESGDIAVPHRYSKESCTDVAVYRPRSGEWVIDPCDGGAKFTRIVGPLGTLPVAADYDGDGIAEPATFDPKSGRWYVDRPTDRLWCGVYSGGTVMFEDRFDSGSLAKWRFVDEGKAEGSSHWSASGGNIRQSHDMYSIGSGILANPGTYALSRVGVSWENYSLAMQLRSDDNGSIGAMFRYIDAKNYYRFEMGRYDGRARLIRFLKGKAVLLGEVQYRYGSRRWNELNIEVRGNQIKVWLNCKLLFDLADSKLKRGKVALYNARNGLSYYDDVVVKKLNSSDQQDGYFNSFTCGLPGDIPVPGDYDGDGDAEPAVYRQSTGQLIVAGNYVEGATCGVDSSFPIVDSLQWGLPEDKVVIADYDGDRKLDIGVYRPTALTFIISPSSTRPSAFAGPLAPISVPFYTPEVLASPYNSMLDVPRVVETPVLGLQHTKGDFTRDGRSDLGYAKIDRSGHTTDVVIDVGGGRLVEQTFNTDADAIVSGDFGGDGRVEVALIHVNSRGGLDWHIGMQDLPEVVGTFGHNGGIPLAGDIDCDGRADRIVSYEVDGYKVWTASFADGTTLKNYSFGLQGDRVFLADTDGDLCQEIVVSRVVNGFVYWFTHQLTTDVTYAIQWGLAGDELLSPSDINGDGADDFVVVREVGGALYFLARIGIPAQPVANHWGVQFGLSGDIPFVGDFSGAGSGEVGVVRQSSGLAFIRHSWGEIELRAAPLDYPHVIKPDQTASRRIP